MSLSLWLRSSAFPDGTEQPVTFASHLLAKTELKMLNLTRKAWPLNLEFRNSINICLVLRSPSTQTIYKHLQHVLMNHASFLIRKIVSPSSGTVAENTSKGSLLNT